MNRKNWLVLLSGVVIGVIATSVYWHTRQEHSRFMFDHNLKCQQVAKQYEAENTSPPRRVVKVMYSSERDSCVAEVLNSSAGLDADYTIEDLLSGETHVVFHHVLFDPNSDLQKLHSQYDTQFASFAHNPSYKPSRLN